MHLSRLVLVKSNLFTWLEILSFYWKGLIQLFEAYRGLAKTSHGTVLTGLYIFLITSACDTEEGINVLWHFYNFFYMTWADWTIIVNTTGYLHSNSKAGTENLKFCQGKNII